MIIISVDMGWRREGIFTLATSKQLAATTSLNA